LDALEGNDYRMGVAGDVEIYRNKDKNKKLWSYGALAPL